MFYNYLKLKIQYECRKQQHIKQDYCISKITDKPIFWSGNEKLLKLEPNICSIVIVFLVMEIQTTYIRV